MTHQGAPAAARCRVPLTPAADLVRGAIAARSHELDELCPAAVDIEAEVVATLHQRLHGDATSHRGNRGAGYFRQQLRGEHPLTVGDLSRLALDAPEALVAALGVLAGHLGYDLTRFVRFTAFPSRSANADSSAADAGKCCSVCRTIADPLDKVQNTIYLPVRISER